MPYQQPVAKDLISRDGVTGDDVKTIVQRLHTTKTECKKGPDLNKVFEIPPIPGLGMKMLPEIEGLETRFRGTPRGKDEVNEVMKRLHTTNTKASTARKDNPRVLLYPERTTLMNNTERILAYQQNCEVAKQGSLARREKWYN